jgi:photosystem II stability/assembly factor-like uncharacterized protein
MSRRTVLIALAGLLASASLAYAAGSDLSYHWHRTLTGAHQARLRGLSAVSASVAWASGSGGTVLRTVDGGQTWQHVGPPGTENLQFRDIEAFDADNAVILSIGNGGDSRVYVTSDGGASWHETFVNDDPAAFYDCMTFLDRQHGLALSDPVGGAFRLLGTDDGGASWHVVPADMPPALPGEFAFAASGQCITSLDQHVWIGSGGGAQSRVYRSDDGGLTWSVTTTPIPSSASAGIFALAFRDPEHGIAVGGDFLAPDASPDAIATTDDGGASWQLADVAPNEYRSSVAFKQGDDPVAIAVGPTGSDQSFDGGRTWQPLGGGQRSFDTVDCAPDGACWASGEKERVAFLVKRR